MCNLSQGIVESTTERNTLDSIRNIMETLNLTIEEAMTASENPKIRTFQICLYARRLVRKTGAWIIKFEHSRFMRGLSSFLCKF